MSTGAPWRDLPERFGPWQTVYDHFRKWRKSGVFAEILPENYGMIRISERLGFTVRRSLTSADVMVEIGL